VVEAYAGVPATYGFVNRNPSNTFDEAFHARLRREIESMADLALTREEQAWLEANCPYLGPLYVGYLRGYRFDPSEVATAIVDGQLRMTIAGPWERTILWEVPLLALVSELSFAGKHGGEDPGRFRAEQVARFHEKADALARILFADFGTRRRRSRLVHEWCVETMHGKPGFVGTSNVWLAMRCGTRPIGTMAHEWVMGVSALEGLRHANRHSLRGWANVYGGRLGIALTDTFGTEAFWRDFDHFLARLYDGVRHDSGDPIAFGERAIAAYQALGIDPMTRWLIFSDGLDVAKSLEIADHFRGRARVSFGIGTHFTNDVPGQKALNIVIKLRTCAGIPVVKLSDEPGKAIGDPDALRVARWTHHGTPL
jgi:nicotinate phosphoribosyltransferase